MKRIKVRMNYGIFKSVFGKLVDIPYLQGKKFYLHASNFSIYSFKYSVTE